MTNNNIVWIFVLGLIITAIVFLLNVYTAKYIIRKAIKQVIKPAFQAKNIELLRHEWLGFFDRGNFKNANFSIGPAFQNGWPSKSVYAEIFYHEKLAVKHITVRIDFDILSIRKVVCSQNI